MTASNSQIFAKDGVHLGSEVFFYLPRDRWPCPDVPKSLGEIGDKFFLSTELSWIYQTWFNLRMAGYPAELTSEIPDEGIVVAFSGHVPFSWTPKARQFLLSVSGDGPSHPFAQINVTQNRRQAAFVPGGIFIPHWPQPGMTVRSSERGQRFERAAFFGDDMNLAPELQSAQFYSRVADLGLQWEVRNAISDRRIDYSDIDVTIAVRRFDRSGFARKPASKLVNAWIAGVPAILGREIAFKELRRSHLDYLEARSVSEVLRSIKLLRDNTSIRTVMVQNGLTRAKDFSVESLTQKWAYLLFEYGNEKLTSWRRASRLSQRAFLARRHIAKKILGGQHKIFRAVGHEHNVF